MLVEKFLYEFRRPKRWEVAVFHFPGEPSQAYVKRVVGLPGESIRISGAMCSSMIESPQVACGNPRHERAGAMTAGSSRGTALEFRAGCFVSSAGGRSAASGWIRDGNRFVHRPESVARRRHDDWLVYKHWDAGRGGYGPMSDFHSYNGNEPRELNEIKDLGIEANVTLSESIETISVALQSGFDRFVLRIPTAKDGEIELTRNGRRVPISNRAKPFSEGGLWPRTPLEAALIDRRFQAAIDGRLLFDPLTTTTRSRRAGQLRSD